MSTESWEYGMAFLPTTCNYCIDPGGLFADGYDRAVRDILRAIAPAVFAKLAGATADEQVRVRFRIDVDTQKVFSALNAKPTAQEGER